MDEDEDVFALSEDEKQAFTLMEEADRDTDPRAPPPQDEEDEDPPDRPRDDPGVDFPYAQDEEDEDPDGAADRAEGPPDRQRFVPHQALHEERRRRQEIERRYQAEMALVHDRLQQLADAQQAQAAQAWHEQQEPEPPPRFAEDPIVAGEHLQQTVEALQHELWQRDQAAAERAEWERQQAEQAQAWQSAYGHVVADWGRHKLERPEALAAYQYVLNSRAQELYYQGIPEHLIPQQLRREEAAAIWEAASSGRRIGDVVMGMAKARGFRGGARPRAEPDREAMRARSKSLSQAGGSASRWSNLTPQNLARMSDREFQRLLVHNPRKMDKLMGA